MGLSLSQTEKRHLICIFLFALVLRLLILFFTPVIGTDCYTYFKEARGFVEGRYQEISHPPLFPLLVALSSMITGEYEIAGKAVALLFGVLAIFPLYFLTCSMFGHNSAVVAALLLAVNPEHVRLSADIMRETTHVFLFITSIYLAWLAIERKSWYWYAILGFFIAMDFLTRPEGGIVLLCVIVPWLLFMDREHLKRHFLQKAAFLVILLVPFLILASSYFLFFRGSDSLTYFVSVLVYDAAEEKPSPDTHEPGRVRRGRVHEGVEIATWKAERKYHMVLFHILHKYIKTLFLPYLPLFLIGFLRFSGRGSVHRNPPSIAGTILSSLGILRLRLASTDIRKEYFVISIMALYLIIVYRYTLTSYVISGRYLLPMVVLSLIWAGKGGEIVAEKLANRISGMRRSVIGLPLAVLLLVGAIVLVSLPKDLKVKRRHEISQKLAGYWIRDHFPERATIMGMAWREGEKVAFYAQGNFTPLNLTWDYPTILTNAKREKVDFLVFYKEKIPASVYSKIEQGENFAFVREWVDKSKRSKKERHLRLYRFLSDSDL